MGRRTDASAPLPDVDAEDWGRIRSPVSWALLGLVIARGDYGYGLVKRFQREYADVLPIKSDWHIYRALDGLQARALIESVPVSDDEAADGAARQPKPHYRSTTLGIRQYADWLVGLSGPTRRHSRLFARQLAMLVDRPECALEVLDRYERVCLSEQRAATATFDDAGPQMTLAGQLASEESRLFLAATLPWLHYARERFEALVAERRRV